MIKQGIVKNNSLSNLVVSLHGEFPDNWPTLVENLNVRLAEKTTVTDYRPYVIKYGLFEQGIFTLNVCSELTVDGTESLYNILQWTWVRHLTLNIHGKLIDDFFHCTSRHVDNQKPLCPITINAWDQLTNEGKALFKEL